ncbi:methyltransferase domain-containing protein [Gimesia panareensis]|uniref:Ubiquinone/menaquinone biosynthesis C-methyltransferase UbiE n=1 Tax=Gimesia panareensis TaxID=2527978 RepID=A0A518AE65_9PLAN|nr:methyltransferase domain-containing protein [Gimesia panareensis]QDT29935.1 Ubiquinone/menaquinone biosynthesis C-methyltransferase UbiE [Gimesia panareensis]QDU53018.1 Ubiquinone/menaquinone biosynthesis C-methyltransferase UbiE [Gimesia panareensis]
MGDAKHYAIRGGLPGRERLRVLGRVMSDSTASLLNQLELVDGQSCLDVGCGGGDVTRELARRVASGGRAVGVDLDATKLDLAREEAQELGLLNVEYRQLDVREATGVPEFDLVYSRFVLTHLRDPEVALGSFLKQLKPGGILAVEDIDFSGSFAWPEPPAFRRFYELYCTVVLNRGGDPHIGQRLPVLVKNAGLESIHVSVVQPTGLTGEVKLLNGLTMENIADAVLADGLASTEEIDQIVDGLNAFAADEQTVTGLPRIVQVWGRLPLG